MLEIDNDNNLDIFALKKNRNFNRESVVEIKTITEVYRCYWYKRKRGKNSTWNLQVTLLIFDQIKSRGFEI